MTHEITIESPELSSALKKNLKEALLEDSTITLTLRPLDEKIRNMDPAVLVAIVGTVSTAIGTLIGGLLKVIEKSKGQTIRIIGKSGRTVEITGKLTPESLDHYVKIAKDLDVERIEVK
nr:hypothetical protein [uncultured Desulfobacter sp.]